MKQLKRAQEDVASPKRKTPTRLTKKNATPKHLRAMPLHEKHKRGPSDLPISLPEYLNLLRWTARQTKDHIAITEAESASENKTGAVAVIVNPPAKIAASIPAVSTPSSSRNPRCSFTSSPTSRSGALRQ